MNLVVRKLFELKKTFKSKEINRDYRINTDKNYLKNISVYSEHPC